MSSLMIDLETLSAAPNATIMTVAAQKFNAITGELIAPGFYRRVDLESQENRDISESTMKWWETQPEAAAEAFNPDDRHSLQLVLEQLTKQIWNCDFLWSKGSFDFVILENAYNYCGMNVPWNFWVVRDVRTVISLWPDCPRPPISHHALEDCKGQIDLVAKTLKHFGIKKIR